VHDSDRFGEKLGSAVQQALSLRSFEPQPSRVRNDYQITQIPGGVDIWPVQPVVDLSLGAIVARFRRPRRSSASSFNDGEWTVERRLWTGRSQLKHSLQGYGLARTELGLLLLLLVIVLIIWARLGFVLPTL
jgi:hypothetical protein